VCQGRLVEFVTVQSPLGKKLVHQSLEAVGVLAFQEVHHLVDQDVFDAIEGFFGELKVEPDAVIFRVAAAPPGLHFLDTPVGDFDPDDGLPLGDQAGH
jgi:hypothetical protein